ncbi:phosphonate C-P lyase system protein PhnG [Plastorhodobacter daqingensis]|uniref:Phosphonate C-P lyase system protein PhnG n=1 Tax=Plastorhodobacter daqingensis TaxID=1387281 RepID=A0ABW2UPT0_9RHOB
MTDHGRLLDVLARAEADAIKALAEDLLPRLGDVEVLSSRTGLVMQPARDPVAEVDFHLGEVLVAEAHIRAAGTEGYGMTLGRDLERSMAMAVCDAAWSSGLGRAEVAAFAERAATAQAEADAAMLRAIEATRVDMETF